MLSADSGAALQPAIAASGRAGCQIGERNGGGRNIGEPNFGERNRKEIKREGDSAF
jgi:hypothetical protein